MLAFQRQPRGKEIKQEIREWEPADERIVGKLSVDWRDADALPAGAEAFAAADPYVTNGLVSSWRVREWTTVVGATAAIHLQDLLE
jgi:hypothetical protein